MNQKLLAVLRTTTRASGLVGAIAMGGTLVLSGAVEMGLGIIAAAVSSIQPAPKEDQ